MPRLEGTPGQQAPTVAQSSVAVGHLPHSPIHGPGIDVPGSPVVKPPAGGPPKETEAGKEGKKVLGELEQVRRERKQVEGELESSTHTETITVGEDDEGHPITETITETTHAPNAGKLEALEARETELTDKLNSLEGQPVTEPREHPAEGPPPVPPPHVRKPGESRGPEPGRPGPAAHLVPESTGSGLLPLAPGEAYIGASGGGAGALTEEEEEEEEGNSGRAALGFTRAPEPHFL